MTINTKKCNPQNYGSTRNSTEYIVVHYTSNLGDTAKNNADYFSREDVGASAHFFVDEKEIWSSVPENAIAWHCGAVAYAHPYCRNSNSIGVEICMNDKKGAVRQGSIDNAAKLVRELMEKYKIPVENVLRHYDITGKSCPRPMVENPALWTSFKNALKEDDEMLTYEQWKAYMEQYAQERAKAPADEYAKEPIARMKAAGVTDGQRPQAFVTRQEVITMIDRLGD